MYRRKIMLPAALLFFLIILVGCNLPISQTPTPFVFPTPNLTMTAIFNPPVVVPPTVTPPVRPDGHLGAPACHRDPGAHLNFGAPHRDASVHPGDGHACSDQRIGYQSDRGQRHRGIPFDRSSYRRSLG